MEPLIKEFMSQNQQIVFDLILEFHQKKDRLNVDEEYRKYYSKHIREYFKRDLNIANIEMEVLSYFFLLRKIASKYILVKNFNEKFLIEQISNDYCKRIYSEEDFFVYGIPYEKHKESGYWCGIEDFIDYKKTLLTEKNIFGFKNLAIAYEIEKKWIPI